MATPTKEQIEQEVARLKSIYSTLSDEAARKLAIQRLEAKALGQFVDSGSRGDGKVKLNEAM